MGITAFQIICSEIAESIMNFGRKDRRGIFGSITRTREARLAAQTTHNESQRQRRDMQEPGASAKRSGATSPLVHERAKIEA